MSKNIKVGVYDWVKFPAQNEFYPEDLPTEWKLSFYANEFETACINIDETLDIQLFEEWIEDLPDNFQLTLNLISTSQLGLLTELLKQTGLKINFFLIQQQERDILLQNESVNAVLSRFETDINKPLQIISSASIWTPDNDVESQGIALLPDTDDKRLYRNWVELWLSGNSQQDLTLWVDGKTARYSNVSELRTLVELMGY